MNEPLNRSRLQTRSWFAVVRAYQTCERQYALLLRHFNMTIAQFDMLTAIEELGEAATPARIANRLLVTKGNITGLLKRLGDQGLLVVKPHPEDRRSQLCRLAPGVGAKLALVKDAAARFISQQLAPFSDDELLATEGRMHRMQQALEQMDIPTIAASGNKAQGKRRGA